MVLAGLIVTRSIAALAQYGDKSGRRLQWWNQSGRMGEGGKVKTVCEGGA